MLIISEIFTPRLLYVLDYVFNQRLGTGFSLIQPETNSQISNNEPSVVYSIHFSNHKFRVLPEGVLQEDFLHHGKPAFSTIGDLPVLFKDEKPGGFGFDIFAAIFWMLSRYEEYQSFQPDEHGRFPAKNSLLYQNNLLNKPIVDIWINLFKEKLNLVYPGLKCRDEKYEFLPTIDIDSPWSYRNKGLKRNVGGLLRDAMQLKFKEVFRRIRVLGGIEPDPFFTFDQLDEMHRNYAVNPLFFILLGPYGMYDKTISINNTTFRNFISQFAENHQLALHPSYFSAGNKRQLEREMMQFEQLTGKVLYKIRQHFLKIKFPGYYDRLIETGILHDYSFGYAEVVGFRAGTSRPFYFYDLSNECSTKLLIHPFAIMDVTLKDYLKLDATEAIGTIDAVIQGLKETNGIFVSLWHNESFDFKNQWAGWEPVYDHLLKAATEK